MNALLTERYDLQNKIREEVETEINNTVYSLGKKGVIIGGLGIAAVISLIYICKK